jgi:hypothetical protein
MRANKLFLASAVLVLLGLASLWSKWDGSAGINAGYPIQQWAVTFNGSVHGWPAMIGVLLISAAIIVFLVGAIRAILASPAN